MKNYKTRITRRIRYLQHRKQLNSIEWQELDFLETLEWLHDDSERIATLTHWMKKYHRSCDEDDKAHHENQKMIAVNAIFSIMVKIFDSNYAQILQQETLSEASHQNVTLKHTSADFIPTDSSLASHHHALKNDKN
ncbi:MAG: hypothetical protein AAGB12_10505 [Pseudomonadota bacterium]